MKVISGKDKDKKTKKKQRKNNPLMPADAFHSVTQTGSCQMAVTQNGQVILIECQT